MLRTAARAALCLLPLTGLVAACGGDDADSSSATTEPASSAAFPVEIEHALGTTTIEAEPQRIVTVGLTQQDTVLALGVAPVGVTDWYGDQPDATWPWAQDELEALGGEPTVLTTTDGFEFEAIAALEPDLIIGTDAGLEADSYETLSAIAPTIAHPVGEEPYFAPWDQQASMVGRAMGKEAEVQALVDDVEEQFAAAAAAHPEFEDQRIIFLQNAFYDGEAIAYQDGLSTKFLTDLGFVIPAELDEFTGDGTAQAFIPLEELPVLDTADLLLWATEKPEDVTALESEPIYMNLEEVKSGHQVFTDGLSAGAIYFTTVLSLPFVLEVLVPALAETVGGDGPSTASGVDLLGVTTTTAAG